METGLTHIYFGDGKGKTTTGMGLCARAAGRGLKVLIYQFMKDNNSGERILFSSIPEITIIEGLSTEKFSHQLTASEKESRKNYYLKQFEFITDKSEKEHYDLLFLDEILYTIRAGLFDKEFLIRYMKQKPPFLELVLTGAAPDQDIIVLADYVSEIKKIKHPYDKGQIFRFGIEQ